MSDGYLGKCKTCAREDNKPSNGKEKRQCIVCNEKFNTTRSEVKKGGGNCCSRNCWYKHFRKTVKCGEDSNNWRGDNVGMSGLHNWVERKKGKPKKCEHCATTKAKQYDWANISQEYKRDLDDFMRLCRSCHAKYDYPTRSKKWKKSVEKLGWKITKI